MWDSVSQWAQWFVHLELLNNSVHMGGCAREFRVSAEKEVYVTHKKDINNNKTKNIPRRFAGSSLWIAVRVERTDIGIVVVIVNLPGAESKIRSFL